MEEEDVKKKEEEVKNGKKEEKEKGVKVKVTERTPEEGSGCKGEEGCQRTGMRRIRR